MGGGIEKEDLWQKFIDKMPDADDVLAYHTQQELNVLDRRLGYIFYVALIAIALYVVVFVKIIIRLSFQFRTLESRKSIW